MQFIYVVPFDYVSTQEFGSIVSERFNTEKTNMQFSHELINAMFKIIFIFMLLFLAVASLTTLNTPF